MEQKLSDTLVRAIDRSNPMMQNLQLASRFNKLVEQGGGGGADLENNKKISITSNGIVEITPTGGKDGMKKVTATVNVSSGGGGEDKLLCYYSNRQDPRCRVVYTDKPATQLHYDTTDTFEDSILPVDEGKHLFIMSLATGGYAVKSINLIYEDGSSSADLKDKFIKL